MTTFVVRSPGPQNLMASANHSSQAPNIHHSSLNPSPLRRSGTTSRRIRALADRGAAVIVWVGGLATILSIMGIFIYLLLEVVSLFLHSESSEQTSFSIDTTGSNHFDSLAIGIDEYQEIAYVLYQGQLGFYDLATSQLRPSPGMVSVSKTPITAIGRASGRNHHIAMGTQDGRVLFLMVQFRSVFENGVRTIVPSFSMGDPIEIDTDQSPITKIACQPSDEGITIAIVTKAGKIWVAKIEEAGGLLSENETMVRRMELHTPDATTVSTLLLDQLGETLFLGTHDGRLVHWDLQDIENPQLLSTTHIGHTKDSITSLAYLIGDRTIILGTQSGTVSAWMPMHTSNTESGTQLTKVRDFVTHPGAITAISPSKRDKGFVTADDQGHVFLHHSTAAQTILAFHGYESPIQDLVFAPKANGLVTLDAQQQLTRYALDNPHPEITMNTLFTPVLYEGYDQPAHIWQSSSGSDDFEPKFGMWPLIFGTLKGTMYAMLLAVPLAVMGAIYTAMFMSRELRAIVKPVIEIMAALPSVVLGFLAGLWFAPLLEEIFPALLAMSVTIPLSVMAACLGWQYVPKSLQARQRWGLDLVILMIVLVGTISVCLSSNHIIESWWFDGNYKEWLLTVFGFQYDQRNALVISFAMGFAVIPIIFSISEDSLSNVPKHLLSGSLALGATPWQTLTKLVLVSASPGIFSALMIGFGRAVGETMIVLMATGNTPIMEWSIFNGFRTLSANIAVEMPEAPHGGTLYRVLFLAGLLLFTFTFSINTIAEIIRQRLRAKYSQY
ncbi:MAG: ABC transporter permease subunit [Nitrospirales bacterium]|nr:ABC transporter permease subunit [Nitrospirales bacterium]